jgi:hypothetical protein
MRSKEVDTLVDQIDKTRESVFFRDPDRPSTTFMPARKKEDPRIRRAKTRARTAAWRNDLDRQRRPESADIGKALLLALVMSKNLLDMTQPEVQFVTAALDDLAVRGFDRAQTLKVLRRLRNRLMDPADLQGEEPESSSSTVMSSTAKTPSTPF